MQLSAALAQGLVEPFGRPDHSIETMLSQVFFFGDMVVKAYKPQRAFYADLADKDTRLDFVREDFFWNHAMAPEIYLRLQFVAETAAGFRCIMDEPADDALIVMKKIDARQTLTDLLEAGQADARVLSAITTRLIDKLRRLTRERRQRLEAYFSIPWKELHAQGLEDLREWVYLAPSIPRRQTDEIVARLQAASARDPWIAQSRPVCLSAVIDANPDNLLWLDGQPGFIDIMPPKDSWKVADEAFVVARLAVDAAVLGGPAASEAVYAAWQDRRPDFSPHTQRIYEMRSALIQWAYRDIIGQPARAARYRAFVLENIQRIT